MIIRLCDGYSDDTPIKVKCSNIIMSHIEDIIVLVYDNEEDAVESNDILITNNIDSTVENNEIVIKNLSSYEITILG